mgnify:CR=1 FL=1
MAHRHHLAALAASIVIATTLTTAPALAQERERTATVILQCDYLSSDGFRTRVAGVETAGAVPARLAAALASEISCSQAATLLADAKFELVHASAVHHAADSDVDGRDFLVWQRSYGSSN